MTSVFVMSDARRCRPDRSSEWSALQERVIAHVVGVSPCGTCHTISPVEIDRREHAVRRLDDRQPLHRQPPSTAASSAGRRGRRGLGRGRRAVVRRPLGRRRGQPAARRVAQVPVPAASRSRNG